MLKASVSVTQQQHLRCILLNNGNGTFKPVVNYDAGGLAANALAVADVNRDGKLDIIVATDRSVDGLLGNGDGNQRFAGDQQFMVVGIDLPTLGCWEIKGRYQDAELTFVVWVAR